MLKFFFYLVTFEPIYTNTLKRFIKRKVVGSGEQLFSNKTYQIPLFLPFFLGEPFHLDQHWFYAQRLDTGTKPWTNPKAIAAFLTIFFTFYCLCTSPYPRYWFPIMAEQKPPRDCDLGKVKPHYTFERIED